MLSSGPLSSVSNANLMSSPSPVPPLSKPSSYNCTPNNRHVTSANPSAPISVSTSPSPCISTTAAINENNPAAAMRFSGHTLDKATKAKVTLENYYSNLISQHKERKNRYWLPLSFGSHYHGSFIKCLWAHQLMNLEMMTATTLRALWPQVLPTAG